MLPRHNFGIYVRGEYGLPQILLKVCLDVCVLHSGEPPTEITGSSAQPSRSIPTLGLRRAR